MNTNGDFSNKDSKESAIESADSKFSMDNDNMFEKAPELQYEGVIEVPEIKDWRYFWKRVLDDMKNKNLIPVKILFFFKYATLFVLYPFLTLQMKSLGLIEWEIGVNQATIPIVAILGPPIAGVIADRIGNFKVVLAIITVSNSGLALLLLLVPVAREIVPIPANLTFELTCSPREQSPFLLSVVDSSVCTFGHQDFNSLPIAEVQCGTVCPKVGIFEADLMSMIPVDTKGKKTYLLPNHISTFVPFPDQKPDLVCDGTKKKCFLGMQLVSLPEPLEEGENDEDLTTTTTTTTESTVALGKNGSTLRLQPTTTDLGIKGLKYLYGTNSTNLTLAEGKPFFNVTQPVFQIMGQFQFNSRNYLEPTCESTGNITDSLNCTTKCFVQYERKLFCSNGFEEKEYNVGLTFGLYTIFRILLGLTSATSFIMFEGAVLAILKQYGGDYGLQRVTATLAAVIASPISGALIYNYDFRPAFYLYAILQTVSAFLTLKIDLEFKQPAQKVLAHLKAVLSQAEILIFFFAMLCSGTAWGYLETFLFLYLKNLGGTEILMGLTISVGGLAGLPLLLFSRPIIKRMGHVNVLSLGLVFYCVRFFGYSFIQNPWSCLFFEAMEAITVSLAITAAATYAVALSSLQTIASVQGIMGGLYFGIGRGTGSFVGGFLIKWYGHRTTLQIFGVGALIAGLLYLVVNLSYLRKHSKASSGLDINNLNGKKPQNAIVEAHNPALQYNAKDLENGKLNNGRSSPTNYEGGYLGPLDVNKFTDIPLDEETTNYKGKP